VNEAPILHGEAESGLGIAAAFTELDWVRRQFAEKLGLDPVPGTFNVRVVGTDELARWARLVARLAIRLDEPLESSCVALCSRALINERLLGAVVVPGVPGYPADKVELIAEKNIRAALGISDGDLITLRILDVSR
jgi:riboflavin kinase